MRDFSILVSFSPSSPLLPLPPVSLLQCRLFGGGDIFTQHQGWILAQMDLQWCPIPIGPSKRSHPLLASFVHFAIFEMLKIATFSSLPEYGSTGLRRSDHDISLAVSKQRREFIPLFPSSLAHSSFQVSQPSSSSFLTPFPPPPFSVPSSFLSPPIITITITLFVILIQ